MEISDTMQNAMERYIQGVCSLPVHDQQFGTVTYYRNYQITHPQELFRQGRTGANWHRHHYNVDVKKYALPANAFLMVIQEHQEYDLLQSVTVGHPQRNDIRMVLYCIGDISSKLLPRQREPQTPDLTGDGINVPNQFDGADSQYTNILLFDCDVDSEIMCDPYWIHDELSYAVSARNTNHIENQQRIKKHFDDLCTLCMLYGGRPEELPRRFRSIHNTIQFPQNGKFTSPRAMINAMNNDHKLLLFEKLLLENQATLSDIGRSMFRSSSKRCLSAAATI